MEALSRLFLCFLIYSVVGWTCETVYCSIPAKRFINRGFLNGPLCPVYGFGALLVLWLLRPFAGNLLLLFVMGMLLTSALEYITAWLLETCFHMKWWDYSKHRFHIHGRVCLENSLLFGLLSVAAVKGLDPFVQRLVGALPGGTAVALAAVLLICLLADFFFSVRAVLQLNGRLKQLAALAQEWRQKTEEAAAFKKKNLEARLELKFAGPEAERRRAAAELLDRLREAELRHPISMRRILSAFPHLDSKPYQEALERVRRAVEEKRRARKSGHGR